MLQLFKRKQRPQGLLGLSLEEQRFSLAFVSSQQGVARLEQCERVEIRNQQQLRELLPRQIEEMGLTGASCNAVLAPRDYNLYLVEAPAVEEDELRAAVRWKIKDLIDIPAEDAVIDIFPVPDDAFLGRSRMLYVVAAVKSRVEQMVELCQRAELELVSIDVPEMAMRNMTSCFANDENGLAFISLSSAGSNLNLTRQGKLYLARKINTQLGPDVMSSPDWESQRERLVLEIQRSLDYYESQMGQNPVSQLIVAPRWQDTQALVSSLDEAIGLQVSALDFARQLDSDAHITAEIKQAAMIVIGAALRDHQQQQWGE
ncbi:MAG: hypothetical protein RQ757_03865 [Pseudomonadales bacterium]|nr:hypothetical protein [Pseudomonadales bacterium]